MTAPPTKATCPRCGQSVEVHREGWRYDHEAGPGITCPGSGEHHAYEPDPEPDRVTVDYVVRRSHGWGGAGCQGSPWFYRTDVDDGGVGHSAEALNQLGRDLPEGSVVRVTVEVVSEGEWATQCRNPFGRHKDHVDVEPRP